MPFDNVEVVTPDMLPHLPELLDIDKAMPLSPVSIRRIVRAAYERKLLAMSRGTPPGRRQLSSFEWNYLHAMGTSLSPHRAVDTFLGNKRKSCPCTMEGPAQNLLKELDTLHYLIVLTSRRKADRPRAARYTEIFEELLKGR